MLSYRHGFHAGNHADVLKHMVLCLILRQLKQKGKPLTYIDTHSGAGAYSLKSAWSQQTGEYKNGVDKIINNPLLQELVPDYYKIINDINEGSGALNYYPGSPMFAAQICDENDSANFMELHPTEYENLKYNLHHYSYCHVHHRDAAEGLPALLPPAIRGGLIFIDPSYELENDYKNTISLVKNAYTKFPQGIFAIWYPLLGKASNHAYEFIRGITKLNIRRTVRAEFTVCAQDTLMGMHGSGMVVCNAPFGFKENLDKILPEITEQLAIDKTAEFKLEKLTPDD